MKRYNIRAVYEYATDGIIAENEDEAYKIFIQDLNNYYVGLDELEVDEDGDVCPDCEDDVDEDGVCSNCDDDDEGEDA